MNIFRLTGDACHVWSMMILFRRLLLEKNAHGISIRSQVLYLVVFVTRYLDLFTTFYSYYNSFLKVFYICTTVFVISAIQCSGPLRETCDKARDTLAYWKLLVPSILLAIIVNTTRRFYRNDMMELLWTFSICLEPLAILPQLFLVFRYREIDTIRWIYDYILFKGLYRAIYIINWIYRAYVEPFYRHHLLVYICGVLQTLVYADFLLFYCKRISVIRWMALRNADVEYVDTEEEYQGGQFELLLEDGLLSDHTDEGNEPAKAPAATNGESSSSQRESPTKPSNSKDSFITILE